MLSRWRTKATALVALLLLLFTLSPVSAQSIPKRYLGWAVAQKLTVNTTSTLTGDVTMGGNLLLTSQAAATITNGATLTPSGSYQPITAAGTVGFGAISAGTAGNLLYLVNTANQTITITDTGTLKLAGNAVLGQFDSLTLLSDGTNWIQVSKADN
jgi:hypothetical protein